MKNKGKKFDSPAIDDVKFRAFGVRVRVEAEETTHVKAISRCLPLILPDCHDFVDGDDFDFEFILRRIDNGAYRISRNNELIPSEDKTEESALDFLLAQLRLTIAEHADSRVFVHAGVVGWKGKAIVLPANSYGGKTTLVRELIKRGAEYYSDEYAVLDEEGLVHPFPTLLSIRAAGVEKYRKDHSFEEFGAVKGIKAIPVGLVLFTAYENDAEWAPEILTPGAGMLEIIPHTIPIRINPEFSLKVLKKILNRAKIAKSNRGDAVDFAKLLVKFAED